VLLCGDSDSLDLPWEAMRVGPNEDEWLGLQRHLARLPYLSEQIIASLRPEDCGAGSQSAAIVCPWDVPGQIQLDEAEAEAMEVAQLLGQAGYQFLPCGEPLMGRSADTKAIQSVLLASPTVVHFAGHGGIVRNEGVLVLWDQDSSSSCEALFGRREMAALKQKSSRAVLLMSRPLVVLNACWLGRSHDFGGQREDLAATFLDEGAGCVIAWPTPVHDEVGRILATLLYVPSTEDQRGLAFTFQKVRSLIERKYRGKNYWWTWFWIRYQGNPYARLPLAARGADIPALSDQRIPRAIELVREIIPNWTSDR
jgi:CHAT domain-containing protein